MNTPNELTLCDIITPPKPTMNIRWNERDLHLRIEKMSRQDFRKTPLIIPHSSFAFKIVIAFSKKISSSIQLLEIHLCLFKKKYFSFRKGDNVLTILKCRKLFER